MFHMNPGDKTIYLGKTNSKGHFNKFGIKSRDRAVHMYIIGKSGMGKSTLLNNMAIQDIWNGDGLLFMDPHGSSIEEILEYIPENRVSDVMYFAPFDSEHPIGFNIMEDVGAEKRHLVVSGLLSAFKKIWGAQTWSSRMENILNNTVLALLEYPGSTILDVTKMYSSKTFREEVISKVTDPLVMRFWKDEYARLPERTVQDATPAIQNKIGQFTSNPLIRNIVGQSKSSFDLREIMDNRKIMLVNLSKGLIGESNASLLGSMITTKLYLAALSRAEKTKRELEKLPPFYMYVDEFQSIANESFADILAEARKYKLSLIIAHQYVSQMVDEVRDAVFGNVGTTVAFRVGPLDVELLYEIFAGKVEKSDLLNIGLGQIYISLLIDGKNSSPFSAETLTIPDIPTKNYVNEIKEMSQKMYAKNKKDVENEIIERLNMFNDTPKSKNKSGNSKNYNDNKQNDKFSKVQKNNPDSNHLKSMLSGLKKDEEKNQKEAEKGEMVEKEKNKEEGWENVDSLLNKLSGDETNENK